MKQERENKRRSGVCKNTFLKSQKIPKQRIPKQFHVFRHVFGPSFSQERERTSGGQGRGSSLSIFTGCIPTPRASCVEEILAPTHSQPNNRAGSAHTHRGSQNSLRSPFGLLPAGTASRPSLLINCLSFVVKKVTMWETFETESSQGSQHHPARPHGGCARGIAHRTQLPRD